jgi:hypothetical protein
MTEKKKKTRRPELESERAELAEIEEQRLATMVKADDLVIERDKHLDIMQEKEVIENNITSCAYQTRRKFNYDIAREICDTVSSTYKSISQLCRENVHWPRDIVIFDWINKKPDFCAMYTRAKRAQIERHTDYMLDLADQETYDPLKLAQIKIQIDTRKWLASKLIPSVYGDAQQITISFEDEQKMKDEVKRLRAELDEKNKKDY